MKLQKEVTTFFLLTAGTCQQGLVLCRSYHRAWQRSLKGSKQVTGQNWAEIKCLFQGVLFFFFLLFLQLVFKVSWFLFFFFLITCYLYCTYRSTVLCMGFLHTCKLYSCLFQLLSPCHGICFLKPISLQSKRSS